ncbi:MAG TPA: aldehyde ferredoxin oxidoreductase N-terminal domain-containing protein [Planctomycetota bacterium]|jgi:aldehyde:ferredoxin oxidoreductase|nr:aldehyde ferredoxin oxidoreductase N-terminal domain-containing protein [Planctomycetota bacterium]
MDRRPTVLTVDLTRLAAGAPRRVPPAPWRGSTEAIDRVGSWSGSALALALLHEHAPATPDEPAPLVLAVGECVRRGIPTAARATVASRSPLTGLLAEGQVGSDLGRRFARIADALVVDGATKVPAAVLILSEDGAVELASFQQLAGADPLTIHRAITAALGPCATLRTGRGGARGIPFACLAAGDDPQSFVGRGGLGAVLGRLGLSAIAVRADPVEPDSDVEGSRIVRLLARSPRLRARAEGGTFEIADALAAGGQLVAGARAWSGRVAAAERTRSGCEGCPTPCGFVFERGFPAQEPGEEGRRQGARFGALYALGPALGLANPDDALALLAACDAAAIDAIETGAVLASAAGARGDRDALLARIEDLVETGDVHAPARRQTLRADGSLAARLGQYAGARGSDPMRTLPFLLADAPASRLRELLAPIPLPPGSEDPRDPAGKGRIVWWHENLMAAIDASGFCAFSAAGLLADGVCTLDELADAIAPAALEPRTGRGLLAAGASIVAVARDLARRYGARTDEDPPAELSAPGMWPEYARLRGSESFGPGSILERAERLLEEESAKPAAAVPPERARRPGHVLLHCVGPLARELDGVTRLELGLPAPLVDVLAAIVREHPRAQRYLLRDRESLAAAYRASRRLLPEDLVNDGDELDLVVALSGGSSLS